VYRPSWCLRVGIWPWLLHRVCNIVRVNGDQPRGALILDDVQERRHCKRKDETVQCLCFVLVCDGRDLYNRCGCLSDLPEKDDRPFLLFFIALMPSNKASILGEGLPVIPPQHVHPRRSTQFLPPRASRLRGRRQRHRRGPLEYQRQSLRNSAKEGQQVPHAASLTGDEVPS
jgi:hypothetical protein